MNIRKGQPEDMTAVLGLIQELAIFEKEPDAVLVTVEDLVRDGFGPKPLFHVFVAEIEDENDNSPRRSSSERKHARYWFRIRLIF